MNYLKVTAFANANDSAGVNSAVSNSIEEELNKTLENDKDMDGKIYFGDIASPEKILSYFKSIMGNGNGNKKSTLFIIPSFSAIVVDLKQMLKEQEKMMKEALMKELNLTGNPDNYNLNELQASSQNSSTQDTGKSTALAQTHSNLTQTDNSLTSLASSIKSDIKANLSIDIYA